MRDTSLWIVESYLQSAWGERFLETWGVTAPDLAERGLEILPRTSYNPRSSDLSRAEPLIDDTRRVLIRTHLGQSPPNVFVREADLTRDPEYFGFV